MFALPVLHGPAPAGQGEGIQGETPTRPQPPLLRVICSLGLGRLLVPLVLVVEHPPVGSPGAW